MANTIDMQDLRYLNLFGNVTKVKTRFCFKYNQTIFFSVPGPLVSKAVGDSGKNVKKISQIIGKKIKIIPTPRGIQDAKFFINAIVSPTPFKNLEILDNKIIITAGGVQNKAALIGRNKRRLLEMQKIMNSYFGKEFGIV